MQLLNRLFHALRLQNLTIRFRILSAGAVLTIAAVLSLTFFITQIKDLFQFYQNKNVVWETMHRSDELMKKINKSEAYLEPIENQDIVTMDEHVKYLKENVPKGDINIINDLEENYKKWKSKSFESPSVERRKIVLDLQRSSKILEKSLLNQNEESKKNLGKKIKFIRKISVYGGLLFTLGFLIFLFSVWFTIMPDLSALIHATHEFKHGNLDYVASIEGKTETAELASAFNNMAKAFKDQTEKLQELNRLKTDFVSTVSHELRTPLTAIKGSIGLILGGVTGPLQNIELKQMLEITQNNTDRLIRLINDVLDIAKIEAGMVRLNFDKESIDSVVRQAIEGVEGFAKTREVNILYEVPDKSPKVVMDRDRMVQVITNLLSNSIKFTDAGGVVKVFLEESKDRIHVTVEDNGHGISQEFMNKMWSKFQQEESVSNKNKEGTGLGLAIVKGLVEEHGGKIWCTSSVGVGSQFTFSLPWNGIDYDEKYEIVSSSKKNKELKAA